MSFCILRFETAETMPGGAYLNSRELHGFLALKKNEFPRGGFYRSYPAVTSQFSKSPFLSLTRTLDKINT